MRCAGDGSGPSLVSIGAANGRTPGSASRPTCHEHRRPHLLNLISTLSLRGLSSCEFPCQPPNRHSGKSLCSVIRSCSLYSPGSPRCDPRASTSWVWSCTRIPSLTLFIKSANGASQPPSGLQSTQPPWPPHSTSDVRVQAFLSCQIVENIVVMQSQGSSDDRMPLCAHVRNGLCDVKHFQSRCPRPDPIPNGDQPSEVWRVVSASLRNAGKMQRPGRSYRGLPRRIRARGVGCWGNL
jgi:hypothetical protein